MFFNFNAIKKFLAVAVAFCSFISFAEGSSKADTNPKPKYKYNLTIDKDMSALSSTDIAMSAIEAYRYGDDYAFRKDDGILMKTLAYVSRFLIANYVMVGNHEISGHGGRAREFGWDVTGYEVNPFSGVTNIKVPLTSMFYQNGSLNFRLEEAQKNIAVDLGGMQASYLLSEKIQDRSFENNSINPTYGISYVVTRLDQLGYILNHREMKDKVNDQSGDDVTSYIGGINYLYGSNYITLRKLRYATRIDWLDPFLFYSLYSYGKNGDMEIPMIRVGEVGYLPAAKLVLTPYGLEKRLVNHIVVGDKYFRTNLSYGKNRQKSYSISLKTNQIMNFDIFSLGTELAFWSQPKMLTKDPLHAAVKKGGLASLQAEIPIVNSIKGLVSVGYKTDGFMEGMPLKASTMIRAGMQISLP